MFVDFSPAGTLARDSPAIAARTWRVRDLWYGLGFAMLAIIGVSLALALFGFELDGEAADIVFVLATLAVELMLGLWVLAAARRRGLRLDAIGLVRPRQWWPMWVAWFGAYGILLGYVLLIVLADSLGLPVDRLGDRDGFPIDVRRSLPVMVLLGLSVVVAAPLCEELFFRGLLFRGLRGFWRLLPAMLVSGALFGVFHTSLAVLVPFSLIGMLFAWASEESGSLLAPMGAHAAVNALSFTLAASGVGQ